MTSHYNIVTQAIHCRQHKSLVCWLFGGIPQELDIPERERGIMPAEFHFYKTFHCDFCSSCYASLV